MLCFSTNIARPYKFPYCDVDIQSPERDVNLRKARDLLRCSGGPVALDSTTNNHLTEDMTSRHDKCIELCDSNVAKLIGAENASEKLSSSSSSNCNEKIDARQEEGHDEDSKSVCMTRYPLMLPENVDEDNNPAYSNHDLDDSTSSSSTNSREYKAICITVISRSSRYVSFPSSWAHTYATFFRATMLMTQVVAVLEEQLRATKEKFDSPKDQKAANKKSKKYQGEYNKEGKKHGYGLYKSKNDNQYLGEWQNDRREGLGIVQVGNGDVFEGQFEDNLKCGIGVYHYTGASCVVLCVACVGCHQVRMKYLSNFVEYVILSVCLSPPMKTENAILASTKMIPGLETASGFLRIGSRHFSSRAIPRASKQYH